MAKEHTLGKMDHNTQEPGTRIESMVMENILGMMEDNMKETGKITTWMVTESTHGKMAVNMRDNTRKTRNMGKVYIPGLMEESTMVSGKMEDSMERVNTYLRQANSVKDCGQMVKEKSGSMNLNNMVDNNDNDFFINFKTNR